MNAAQQELDSLGHLEERITRAWVGHQPSRREVVAGVAISGGDL